MIWDLQALYAAGCFLLSGAAILSFIVGLAMFTLWTESIVKLWGSLVPFILTVVLGFLAIYCGVVAGKIH